MRRCATFKVVKRVVKFPLNFCQCFFGEALTSRKIEA